MKKTSKEIFGPVKITRGNVMTLARSAYKEKGLDYIIRNTPKYLRDVWFNSDRIWLWYYKLFKTSETFKFQGNSYHYLFHHYCTTWKNERCVVVPIVLEIMRKYQEKSKRILEIGNMLSYFYPVNHDILDKYEIVKGVINEDVVEFKSSRKYDLIFSLMSLQCVGYNELSQEPRKILLAIENLRKVLAPGGQMVIFHGLGENKEADMLLKDGLLRFDKQFYLRRMSDYKWKEVDWKDVKDLEYDHSIPTANGVVIGVIEKNNNTQSEIIK
jgi:SAM-dependent methyltransferase